MESGKFAKIIGIILAILLILGGSGGRMLG